MKSFLQVYAIANRLHLLRFRFVQRLFAKAYFLYKAFIEDPFTPLVRRNPSLFAGGNILDVGANIGYTAVLFAKVLSPGFRVYAFEPEERNFKMLQTSLNERGLTGKVSPIHAAVGDKAGTAELWLNEGHHADHRMITQTFQGITGSRRETQQVPVLRLDDFCAQELSGQPIRFIKIDVQGFEESVCRGMTGVLATNLNAIIGLEYYPSGIRELGFNPANILTFFQEKGYSVYSLTRQWGLKPVSYEEIPHTVAKASYIDLLFCKSGTILDGTPE